MPPTLEVLTTRAWVVPSDMSEHVPTLYMLASLCHTIIEFGVRQGVSTIALLAGLDPVTRPNTSMHSYDIRPCPIGRDLEHLFAPRYHFSLGSSLTVEPEPCDLLLLDTLHTHAQLAGELERHGDYAGRYIVLHDTTLYGNVGEDNSSPGINLAWQTWADGRRGSGWHLLYSSTHSCGLTVLERLPVW